MAIDQILFIDAAVSPASRTRRLAQALLSTLPGVTTTRHLEELSLKSLDFAAISKRMRDIERQDYQDYPLAKEFADADVIVLCVPFYDCSFPSLLKVYLENIYVMGLVTSFSPEGRPIGLCKAKKLYYVSTSGGPFDPRYGYDYWKTLCQDYFGIKEVELISVEMIDVFPDKAERILLDKIHEITHR